MQKRKMKLLFTGMEWFPECLDGGLDRYYYEKIQALAGTGVSGTALATSCVATNVRGVAVEPMAGKGEALFRRWKGARSLARTAINRGVDAVNAHFALYAFPWIDLLPRNVPLVVNFHGPWADEVRAESRSFKRRAVAAIAQRIEQQVYRRADRVITLSAAFRDLLHQRYGVPLDRIRVVPGALYLDQYLAAPEREEARRRMWWPSDRPILLSIRRLARRMGLDLLIEAMADIRREFPDVLLLIGGKGPQREELERQISEQGLQENVRLLGFVAEADLPLAYAAADLSVVPTLALEGFGLITAESLASGTPVLGTPVGATPEILTPLDPNLVFASATATAMAERIRAALRKDFPLPCRKTCREYVQRYAWPAVVPKLMAIYQEAIQECRGR